MLLALFLLDNDNIIAKKYIYIVNKHIFALILCEIIFKIKFIFFLKTLILFRLFFK
jgi:hypothetical protein